jgi:biopolymer transport protein ExbB/TolQ
MLEVAFIGAAISGSTASGVSKATVAAMAGIVVAIAGTLMISLVDRQVVPVSDQLI